MKKVLSICLVLILTIGMLAGCSSPSTTSNEAPATEAPAAETPVADKASDDTEIVKMGLGHIISIAKSTDLGVNKDGKEVLAMGEVDTVIVAAAFDKDGKVAKVSIDSVLTKVDFDKALQVSSDLAGEYKTKVELGDEYGMIKGSAIKKEWYQQADELGKWMVGKTIDEIKAMKVKAGSVPDVAELTSVVTISVQDYVAALEEAYNNAVDIQSGAVKLGLGHEISIASSKGLGTDKNGKEVLPLAQVDTVMVATAFDKEGKVVGTIIDNAQTKIQYDKEGKVTSDKAAAYKTKVELKEEYGMIKASSIKKEWYQQADALGKWMVGKTMDEIKAMKVKEKDAAHPAIPDVAELTSLVTISVQDYIAAAAESYENAK